MKEFNLSRLRSGLHITEAEREEGIILKIDKEVFEKSVFNRENCFVVRIMMVDEGYEEKEPEDTRPVIPGHPNCRVGDCFGCQVADCAIHQGYEEMP